MVAVLNYWDFGEAFFRLSATDLPAGEYAISDEEGMLWTKDREHTTWSAADLARGLVLVVPATRTRVFEIVPAGTDPAVAVRTCFTQDDVRDLFKSRRAALRAAADADAVYERENRCEPNQMQKGEVYR